MALSNAERQRLHRQRTKDKLATAGEAKRTTAAMRSAGPFSDAEFTADEKLTALRWELSMAETALSRLRRSRHHYVRLPDEIAEAEQRLRLWQELTRDYERLVGAPDGYVTLEDEEGAADAADEERRLARAS